MAQGANRPLISVEGLARRFGERVALLHLDAYRAARNGAEQIVGALKAKAPDREKVRQVLERIASSGSRGGTSGIRIDNCDGSPVTPVAVTAVGAPAFVVLA